MAEDTKSKEYLMRLLLSGLASLSTFIVVSFFNGFITVSELQAEVKQQVKEKMSTAKLEFVGKEQYNEDQKQYVEEITAIKAELQNMQDTQREIKKGVNTLLKRI